MKNRQNVKHGRPHDERGAALVVAIAIMTILLAIGLTFYAVSRAEVQNANNVRNTVQVDLAVDGTLARVMSELNRDFLKHPNATSTDFRSFSYFNGSWAVGKQHALRDGVPLQAGGVPLVDLSDLPDIRFKDGYREPLYQGPRSRDWLYYPRFEGNVVYMYADPANPVTDVFQPGTNVAFTQYRDNTNFVWANFDISLDTRPPFVTPAFYGLGFGDNDGDGNFNMEVPAYPLELIHNWADVDNDEDGLRDGFWQPIPMDRFFSGGEVVETNPFGARMFDDGIDNNLNGIIDENQENGFDDNGDGNIDGPNEAMELGTFVYHGLGPDRVSGDGLDNDGNGVVDDAAAEDKLFLTGPLPGITIPIDFNADGAVPDFVPDEFGVLQVLTITLPDTIDVLVDGVREPLRAEDVDVIDNDYDMLINDYQAYVYVGPNAQNGPPFRLRGFELTGVSGGPAVRAILNYNAANDNLAAFATAKRKEYEVIDGSLFSGGAVITPALGSNFYSDDPAFTQFDYAALLPDTLVLSHAGEPVCDIAGRAAVTVRDEAGKMNVDVAGGHHYDPLLAPVLAPGLVPAFRSLGAGLTAAELETRNLPAVGLGHSQDFWLQRAGTPANGTPVAPAYELDTAFAGYGRVDDNANVLVSAFNGEDDDGDGLIDEGLYLPPISARAETYLAGGAMSAADETLAINELIDVLYPEYYAQLGAFEGVDEPGEFQRYRPLLNLEAEGRNPYKIAGVPDLLDNDGDGAVNELGELGDLHLQDPLQLADISGYADLSNPDGEYSKIAQVVSTFSTDRNVNFIGGRDGIRAVNKLDYNFATPQQIAANLLIANPFQSVTARPLAPLAFNLADPLQPLHFAANSFAEGLRQGDIHIRSRTSGLMWGVGPGGAPVYTVDYFAADPVLQVLQAAVDIVDNRDSNHNRSLLVTERSKSTSDSILEANYFDSWPAQLGIRERIGNDAFFPLGQIQDHLHNTLGSTRQLAIHDQWWSGVANVVGASGELDPNGDPQTERRDISYAASGTEAIRINEIMVRPVRRVEAEAVPEPAGPFGTGDPMTPPITLPVATAIENFDPTPFGTGGDPSVLPEFDVTRETTAEDGWALENGGFLGETSFIGMEVDGTDATSVANAFDVLEFTIGASDGLPPGRYYLTVNTSDSLGNATVVPNEAFGSPILQAAVKYRNTLLGDTTIIADLPGVPFEDVPDEHIGGGVPGAPNGWVFIDGTPGATGNYYLDGLPAHDGAFGPYPDTQPALGVSTFAITVPPVGSDYELRIAFRLNPAFIAEVDTANVTFGIAINSLDFSQEPDHEWLELVNVSDETVNIGGWEMEVGIPDRPTVPDDPFKSTWRIPPGTEIAPRGMVLLGVNKFDSFRDGPASHQIANNGMGLADGDELPFTENILTGLLTVPPIADTSSDTTPGATDPALLDVTGSVFRRFFNPVTNALTDYLDADGDGRTALRAGVDPAIDNLANDTEVASSKELGTLITSSSGNLPWDRIIQLEPTSVLATDNPFTAAPSAKRLQDVTNVADLAALVLRGGIFPNYPERDGYDNDGDGGYALFQQRDERTQLSGPTYDIGSDGPDGVSDWIDASEVPGVPNQYVPGILDTDMVDNNFSGYVDERPYQGDPYVPLGGVDSSFYRAYLSEGVDEGRGLYNNLDAGRRFGAGSYEFGTLPFALFPDRADWSTFNASTAPAANFPDTLASNPDDLQYGINTGIDVYGDPVWTPVVNEPAFYIGSDDDPADWKAFMERRWYPGDNVIVTLYEGPADNGSVVDRVTYREADVINRTIDDIAPIPYTAVAITGTIYDYPGLNPDYPSMWLPNHMGLDFYRSLERKYPLYNGDRFGTTNRWEATDGNYDDWSDSISLFEDEIDSAPSVGAAPPLRLATTRAGNARPRFLDAHPAFPGNPNAQRNRQLFSHAIWGSPLRMNTVSRRGENLTDLELLLAGFADARQFPNIPGFTGPFDYFRTHEDPDTAATPALPDQRWNLSRAVVANESFGSPGDLMRVPHQIYLHDAINTADPVEGYLRDMTMVNYGLRGDLPPANLLSYQQDIALRGATLGQDPVDRGFSPNVLEAAINGMASDTTVLTVGQAEFRPILPVAADVGADPGLINWVDNPASGNPDDLLAPGAWAPVFLFALGRDSEGTPPVRFDHFPNYPTYVDGTNANAPFDSHYLFNTNFVADAANFGGLTPYNFTVAHQDRWPLETRTAMYVSENRGSAPAEAVFIWDGADGLENGEYTLYIGTFLPKMRERIEEAAKHAVRVINRPAVGVSAKSTNELLDRNPSSTDNSNLELDDGTIVEVDPVTKSLLTRDPTNPRRSGPLYDPVYAIDVITNPSEARGQAPALASVSDPTSKPGGLIHPDDWNPLVQYQADPDGYIFYGNNAVGGWKPEIVRVTDNFLALRVRNVGMAGEVGALTHIVLAPRKRTAGRVNVNTADSRIATFDPPVPAGDSLGHEYYSTLLGLPGVVDVAQTVQPSNAAGTVAGPIGPGDEVVLMRTAAEPPLSPIFNRVPWTPPGGPPFSPPQFFYDLGATPPTRNQFTGDLANPDSDLLVPNTGLPAFAAHRLGAFRLNAMLMGGRTEHADGRYYESVGDLVNDANAFDYAYQPSRADLPELAGGITDGVEDAAIYPLSNEANPAKRYDEVRARFDRLGNLVTTRSDVYKIMMTVEAGYGVDRNGDGFIDYRSADEFVTTGRTKASAVYERRAPSDQSDGLE